jgi:GntR family transcriptional regulator/MocR family aminotransferase
MHLPIPLVRGDDLTLQEQIYRFIRDRILSSHYRAELQLPSSRDLADALHVSRNTVVLAYQWLTSEGYIETRRGAGTFVCKVVTDTVVSAVAEADPALANDTERPRVVIHFETPILISRSTRRPQFDFWYGRPDHRQFPVKTWSRLLSEHLTNTTTNLADYTDQAGLVELREAIADHLATAKGLTAGPNQVVVTSGAQDGLNLICRLFIQPGAKVAMENPTYAAAATLFRSYGAELIPTAIDEEGLVPGQFEAQRPTLVYTTPSHQFPTGVVMSLVRRQALLSAARAANAYIIEDDYDGEVIYDRPPIAALTALDQHRRTIYVGSFSKSIGAGLRLGFLVLPEELVAPAMAIKSLSSYGQAWLEQAVLATFIREGSFRTHLRRIRTVYRARRDTLASGLKGLFGDDTLITGADAGLHLICTLPEGVPDASAICESARSAGVGFYTPESAGALQFGDNGGPDRRLALGYAALTHGEIETALTKVEQALKRG